VPVRAIGTLRPRGIEKEEEEVFRKEPVEPVGRLRQRSVPWSWCGDNVASIGQPIRTWILLLKNMPRRFQNHNRAWTRNRRMSRIVSEPQPTGIAY